VVSRAVAVTTAWDMLVWGDLAATDFVRCVTAVLAAEPADSLVDNYLSLAVEAADMWSPDAVRDGLLGQVADVCLELSAIPARRQVAVRALAQTAVTTEHIAALRRLAGDDVDLRWRTVTRLAELDSLDPAEVDQIARDDPDPDSWVRVLAVDSSRPDPAKRTPPGRRSSRTAGCREGRWPPSGGRSGDGHRPRSWPRTPTGTCGRCRPCTSAA
jgi:aminopeptidase N